MSRNRYAINIQLTAGGGTSLTTVVAALALALEGEAIKEVGTIDVERIDVEHDEEIE